MELQRFIIQKSLVTETEPDLKQLIPVFHRWIQQQEIEGHLLIDVGDYLHLRHDPRLLLVAHEVTLGVIRSDTRTFLQYQRRRPSPDSLSQRILQGWSTLQQASDLLEQESELNPKFCFQPHRYRFISNDHLWQDTAADGTSNLKHALEEAFTASGNPGCKILSEGEDTNRRLMLEFDHLPVSGSEQAVDCEKTLVS